jgi:hypothetical protein
LLKNPFYSLIFKFKYGLSKDRNFSVHHPHLIDDLLYVLKDIVEKYSKSMGFSISDYQEQEIDRVLWEYALQLANDGMDEESIDKQAVIKLVEGILM